ncbi:MAG TPA: LamG domain-containing protein [Verrucomicrobiae bacterium]|nr:LamG domain-containing protein [Verrucomicrobiae bacterium]
MKSILISISKRLFHLGIVTLGLCLALAPARAGLTVDIHLYHDTYGYYFYPWLSTNSTTPDFPTGNYMIASPQIPTGGSQLQYQVTNDTLNFIGGGGNYYGDFDSFLYGITNGQWSIFVTNSVSTNQYNFTVTVTGVTSNSFGAPAVISVPNDRAQNVSSQPTFQWSGPANWAGDSSVVDYYIDNDGDYNYEASTSLSEGQTSWLSPVALPNGTNQFSADYSSNVTAQIIASTPLNSSSQPISGWISTATLETSGDSTFVVGSVASGGSSAGHTLIAHYAFDDSGNLGLDSSLNDNNINGYSSWGAGTIQTSSADSVAGNGAVEFYGTSSLSPFDQTLTNWNSVLAGSFTFSTWVKTTDSRGNDDDDAVFGATIFWAYNDHNNVNDTIPLAITGSKAAFTTRDDSGNSVTVHSISTINDGNYHLITVTRNQTSGEMKIYVDGQFEASQFGTTEPLNGNDYYLSIGGTTTSSYTGLLDDLQIYSGVLSADEISTLYDNPGVPAPDVAGSAANGLIVHYDFDEGSVVAPDVSGNGNNIIVAGNTDYYDGDNPVISNDTISGAGSVNFDGYGFLTPSTNLLSTIAGTFSLSLWVKTTDDSSYQGDVAWDGACIVSADSPNDLENGDIIPVALTGGQVAFNTGSPENGDDTLNSSVLVNDGQWHHIVVMRNQLTGEKDIYIDGELDNSDFDTTNLLTDPQLLTIGCKADASNSDPDSPTYTGSNGYTGLVDDIQIYNRVLSPDEVLSLYNNPGSTAGGSSYTPYPVDVSLQFSITRSQDPYWGDYYSAGVSFNSVSPAATTTNSVHSPHDYFSTETFPSGGSGSGAILYSLGDVLNELTNGFWKIYINQGSPTQQVYSFQMSVTGLDTNLLPVVSVFSPTNGAINVATNPIFYWNGPTNYSTLLVDLLSGPVATLPVTATNWPNAPTLNYGSDRFDVDYTSNNFPGVTFTTPVDASSNPVRTWSATLNLSTISFNNFTVGAPAPLPVNLINLHQTGQNLQFGFQTLAGRPHTIQTRTNLSLGVWIDLTNFVGDGSLQQFVFPATNSPAQFFRVNTQ